MAEILPLEKARYLSPSGRSFGIAASEQARKRRHHARKRKRSGEPAVSRHDESPAIGYSSALEREAEAAPHSSQGQQVSQPSSSASVASSNGAAQGRNKPSSQASGAPGESFGWEDANSGFLDILVSRLSWQFAGRTLPELAAEQIRRREPARAG